MGRSGVESLSSAVGLVGGRLGWLGFEGLSLGFRGLRLVDLNPKP